MVAGDEADYTHISPTSVEASPNRERRDKITMPEATRVDITTFVTSVAMAATGAPQS